MTMERNLTLREDMAITPSELVENASTQAKLLMNIVEQTKCYQTISGKKYLQVEAWETIGAFNRVHAITKQMLPIMREGEVVGYQADVILLRDGMEVGGASMPCFFTENACKGKEGDAKHKACMSAAQTFATSKAYRMNYSYVAILAGYQPTPAEEMTGEAVDDRPTNLEHWCEKHQTKWFKRGKMKAYAHPIGDTGEWCHEHKEQPKPQAKIAVAEPEPEEKQEAPQETTEAVLHPSETETSIIDLEWLREALETLQSKGLKAWSNATVVSYLNNIIGQKFTKVSEAVKHLNQEQADDFAAKVQEALDMA